LAAALWEQSRVLNDRRKDHPISPATIRKMADGRDLSCQRSLFVLRWLGVPPEAFIAAPAASAGSLGGRTFRSDIKLGAQRRTSLPQAVAKACVPQRHSCSSHPPPRHILAHGTSRGKQNSALTLRALFGATQASAHAALELEWTSY